ncbi:NAD(P)-dependent oxidoreductase [Dermacoccus sp. Tok2021]|uniref:NAD-dependent epimerase/dehydratase family protein n=1 Tax=Dermacoccus sp. Tok2021 TaxID=2826873 RepID=UPI001CA63E44|nr:NAD(P)-dependent oxidoreductase [Dermacoccus sp. Tok2021]MBZ4497935.1 NAD(P)-dependent oxidoreductase [Dermacoccus sp. Tok2021]
MALASETWLLTGANGNIGQNLRGYLRRRVAHLVVADLTAPENPAANETAAAFDLTDAATLPDLVAGCDGVVHLAGIPDEAPYADLLRVNAMGTYNLLEAMRQASTPRLVYASSNRATGFHSTDDLLDDTATIRPDGLYGASKAATEALVRLYSDKFGLQASTVRIGSYEREPSSAREAATWLSLADANLAFEAAMTTDVHYSLFYAVSANRHRFWSLEPGRAIGYVPQDDAANVLGGDARPGLGIPQAGDMASAEYTQERM